MSATAIVDYGLCNLDSVCRAVEECGGLPLVCTAPDDLLAADRLILPGVGAFPAAMENLRERGLVDGILSCVEKKTPLLGICLGMQLLADCGTEVGKIEGLGIVPGTVKRLEPKSVGERLPHMGWNQVEKRDDGPLFEDIPADKDFYFVHSFHFQCDDPANIAGTTPYCGGFVSAIRRGNVYGVQFHPEKSHRAGFALLKNFLGL